MSDQTDFSPIKVHITIIDLATGKVVEEKRDFDWMMSSSFLRDKLGVWALLNGCGIQIRNVKDRDDAAHG